MRENTRIAAPMISFRREGRCAGNPVDFVGAFFALFGSAPAMMRSMPQARTRRPANRPSRRQDIVNAAVELLSVQLPDAISVADVASHAGMTSAAFYYHFPSKDDLVDEIVHTFSAMWQEEVTAQIGEVTAVEDLSDLMFNIIDWLDENERMATVFFVTVVAATATTEMRRKAIRDELVKPATRMFRAIAPHKSVAEATVAGLGLIILLEVTARSRLQMDESYRGLGPVRFRSVAAGLAMALATVPDEA